MNTRALAPMTAARRPSPWPDRFTSRAARREVVSSRWCELLDPHRQLLSQHRGRPVQRTRGEGLFELHQPCISRASSVPHTRTRRQPLCRWERSTHRTQSSSPPTEQAARSNLARRSRHTALHRPACDRVHRLNCPNQQAWDPPDRHLSHVMGTLTHWCSSNAPADPTCHTHPVCSRGCQWLAGLSC